MTMIGRQVEPDGGVAVTRDLLAQRGRQRINQAAFHAARRDDALSLALDRQAVDVMRRDGQRGQVLARVAAAEMFAPVDVEAAIGRRQRCHGHALPLQQRHPGAVGTQARPAAATERQDHGVEGAQAFAVGRGKGQLAIAPARPAVAHVKLHARFAQAVQPGAQQRRGLHIGRENAVRRADEGLHAQAVHPVAHLLRAELIQRRFHPVRLPGVARDEGLVAFRVRDIHAAAPGQQEFAADGRHGVEQFHLRPLVGGRLGGHQAGGAAADDGDVEWRKAGVGHGKLGRR